MIRRSLISLPLLFMLIFSCIRVLSADVAGGAAFASFGAFDGGFEIANGSVFGNRSSAGNATIGNAASANFRSYASVLSASIRIIDAVISFLDESPSSTELQPPSGIVAKITVDSVGNSIEVVKYRISNSGSDEDSFHDWRSDPTVDPSFASTSTRKRYMITLPNSAGDNFSASDNNYIQWKARNSGGVEYASGKYRIRVSSTNVPTVEIIQPDEKGGFASTQPLIYALLRDQNGGIDANTVQIRIDNNVSGANIAVINAATTPGIVTSSGTTTRLYYRYDQTPLQAETPHKLTIRASDVLGIAASASVVFTPKAGAIADLVPYPSPFDPRVQPVVIRYVLSKKSTVSVNIYDMGGRMVRNIVDGQFKDAGINEDTWNGSDYSGGGLANGVYFCEIVAKDGDGEHRRYTSLAIFGK